MKRSRRRFLKVFAAGAAAALVTPATVLAQTAKRIKPAAKPGAKPAPKPAPVSPAPLASEVAKQKASLAQTLKTLREFPLENGAEPGFVFRAMRRARGGH